MAGDTFADVSGLVLLPVPVITQEHNLRECQSVHHKIKTIFSKMKMVLGFYKMPFVIIFMHRSETKYIMNLVGNSTICYVPS